jgi:DNA-directed RNA polymerase subunit beta'
VADSPIDQQWESIQRRVTEALTSNFPMEGKRNKLVLNSPLFIDDRTADHADLKSQEDAKLGGRTWGAPVIADVSLIDKETGQQIDRTKIKLLTLPKPTQRYSYIVDGNEWQVDNLWKLRSGVYAHIKQNGELQAEFNLKTPFAKSPRLYIPFSPEKKQFKFRLETSHFPLYSILKTMGVGDEAMKKEWGEDIYKANVVAPAKIDKDINNLYSKLAARGVKSDGDTQEHKVQAILETFHDSELIPETTKATLGKPMDRVNGEALLLASKRILEVARGDIPPDDRDSLVFKELHTVDDFLHDTLTKYKTQRVLQQKIGHNIDRQVKVRDVLSGDLFSRPVIEFFSKDTLSRNPEQVNPLEMMSNHRATTIIAPEMGGIKNERSVTGDMTLINPSHLGFLDPIHTPESEKTGITLHLPLGVKKEGNEAKIMVYDLQQGKIRNVGPAEFHSEHIVLPDQVKWKDQKPVPINTSVKMKDPRTHEIIEKPFSNGRFLLMTAHQLFDEATNLIPFLQNNQGNRTMTASRQATQAVGLLHRESPLVQVRAGSGHSWEKIIGSPWTHRAPASGKVIEIQKNSHNGHADAVIIQDKSGQKHTQQVYNHFPLNDSKSFMHAVPNVKVGDKVEKGQLIADSNYTKDGNLALGTNLRVTYLPYKGYNFEDGIVISDSAAKKLTSEHMHRASIEVDPEKDFLSKSKFVSYASTASKKLNAEQLSKLGDDGIIHVGTKVIPGDILIAAVGKKDHVGETARMIGRLDKKMFSFQDKSVTWDSQHDGEVVKVVRAPNGKGATIFVKTMEPAEIGDKMVGRHGNKGIITRILPDGEMPRIGGPDGTHTEVLMNPSGVPTRLNLGQMLETASSKIALKTGEPYLVQNFGGVNEDYSEKIKAELKKHGLSDEDDMYDAPTGKKLGSALNGHQYILKLKHQVEKKLAVRGGGNPRYEYSLDRSPKGTGANFPGQAIGQLEFYALLAHGARHNLREMATYKAEQHLGNNNDQSEHIDFWHRVQTGQPLPPPKAPFVYKKFEAMLTGLGINIKKEGHQLVLQPLTDKGVLALSAGEITDPGRVLRGKDAKELEKGLFDLKVTGGLPNDVGKGLKWSHITLPEPMPNPIFVGTKQHPGPAVVLSGMKFDEFEEVARGQKSVKTPSGDTKTGGHAIQDILSAIQVKPEIKKLRDQLPKLRGTDLDKSNRKLKYLIALDGLGMKPQEAYVMKHIPVLPPIFRPIIPMQDGALRFDDINHYYKSLGHIIKQYKEAPKELGEEGVKELREEMYDVTRSLAGLAGGTPVYDSNRQMKGLLDTISGTQPKEGYFQKRLMKRRQDLSMRSTIIPEPAMHLDHVGLPRDAAMELYKPFVVREMQSLGYSPVEALKEIKAGSNLAWKSLQGAMDKRPVMLKRDPALHKFSIMAFKPRIVDGKAIKIHPLVTAGYNADFDGDTMSAFVPLTDDAVRETYKMFPSNNLFSSTNGGIMYAPEQEAFLGLHLLSRWGKDSGKTFANFQEAMKSKERGQLHVTDGITINGHKTTLGRAIIAQHLPEVAKMDEGLNKKFQDPEFELHKKDVHHLLEVIAKHDPKSFPVTVDHLKDLGNQYSYELGFSFGLKDIGAHKSIRDPILKRSDADASKVKLDTKLTPAQKHDKIVDIYTEATKELVDAHRPIFKKEDNNMYRMVSSGARGKMEQFRQMTIAPMLMKDGAGNTLATPVRKSYSEGLDVGDYWTSLHGARMGTLQRVEGTSEPGRLTKEIVNVVIPNMIVSKDCGTSNGIHLDIHDPDIHDRYLAASIKLPNDQVIKAGTLIDGHITSTLKKHHCKQVVVRSPLKCNHGKGLCSKCFGLNENGNLHEIGTNIGVLAGHALGEPATQLAMDSFHTGGVAASRGGASVDKFTRLNQLLELPKVLPNAAILASISGKVTKIERDMATNGWNVHVGKEHHYVPAQRTPTYEGQPLVVGTEVKKGDPITDGHINPREYLKHTDIHTVQNYLTNELYNGIYKDERVRRRNIETVVRSLTNYTQIKDPGDSHHLHGDYALRTVVEEHNRNLPADHRPIEHQPVLKGAQQMALGSHEDWMARLNFQQLRNTLLEGTAKGWKTDLHGTNPIPAYAFGAEFGLGTPDKNHHY